MAPNSPISRYAWIEESEPITLASSFQKLEDSLAELTRTVSDLQVRLNTIEMADRTISTPSENDENVVPVEETKSVTENDIMLPLLPEVKKEETYGYVTVAMEGKEPTVDRKASVPSTEQCPKETTIDDCDWNSKFRKFTDKIKKITSSTPLDNKIQYYTELSNLAEDFNHTAKTYAKIVIIPLSSQIINIFSDYIRNWNANRKEDCQTLRNRWNSWRREVRALRTSKC